MPAFLDALDSAELFTPSADKKQLVYKKFLLSHWRGRMGLDKASAQEAYRLLAAPLGTGATRVDHLPTGSP